MIQEFKDGGPMMYFLLICAILGIGVLIERFFTLMIKARINPKKFVNDLIRAVDRDSVDAAIVLCARHPSPVAKVLRAGLERADRGKEAVEERIANAAATELAFLDRGMGLLAGVITVAPFLGFLGTVNGMIGAFKAIAAAREVAPEVVASGISEALITTKWGLMIAAPLAIFHVLLTGRINGYTRDMEESATRLVDYIVEGMPKKKAK
ncbi:MAG TPA: MotA/TolQ/ExbB proton channel family protein [bacterium (Candidatus Stahlbacteria)]|nr:MotA/TolQ/ExbB proton channel family protein [Candidatus Stahlbacteria bacterium]